MRVEQNDSVGAWESIDYNDRGWRFFCPYCDGEVYWPQATRGDKSKIRICPYPYCPWCLKDMKGGE